MRRIAGPGFGADAEGSSQTPQRGPARVYGITAAIPPHSRRPDSPNVQTPATQGLCRPGYPSMRVGEHCGCEGVRLPRHALSAPAVGDRTKPLATVRSQLRSARRSWVGCRGLFGHMPRVIRLGRPKSLNNPRHALNVAATWPRFAGVEAHRRTVAKHISLYIGHLEGRWRCRGAGDAEAVSFAVSRCRGGGVGDGESDGVADGDGNGDGRDQRVDWRDLIGMLRSASIFRSASAGRPRVVR